jgi:hypothetical protein
MQETASKSDKRASQSVPAAPRKSGGLGCWVTGFTSLVVAVALIGVGLLLPPFNLYNRLFGTQYTMLSETARAVSAGGLTLAVDGILTDDFGVAINAVPMERFLAGDAGAGGWIPQALASAPAYAALQSAVYTVATSGTPPDSLNLRVNLPSGANPDLLSLYGWNGHEWEFLPSEVSVEGDVTVRAATVESPPEAVALFQATPSAQPRVLVSVDVTQVLSPEAAELATIVAPAGLQPTADGRLAGSLAAGFDLNAGYLVMPSIRNYSDPRAIDPDTISAILSDPALREEHALQIAAFASAGYDGVLIDYRELPAERRDDFSAFIASLSERLDDTGLLLGVSVPAVEDNSYDWRALGRSVDILQIDLPLDPTAFAPDGMVDTLLSRAVGEVSREKLLLGLTALSARQAGNIFTPIGIDQALSALGDVAVEVQTTQAGTVNPGQTVRARLDGFRAATGIDTATGQPFIDYFADDNSTIARMWLTTPAALHYRMDRTLVLGLGGVAFDDLMANGVADGVDETILSYKLQVPPPSEEPELALRWTIEGTNGVIGQTTTDLNGELVATIEAPDGNYAINVEIVQGGDPQTQRGGAAVAVFAPTATPTPLPTSTPTPTPAPTFTPNPAAIAQAAAPANDGGGGLPVSGAAIAPGAGSIVGGFEYGGHVTSTASEVAANALRSAGGTWMKVQIQYGAGASPAIAQDAISNAHSRGFKVLLGVVGNPAELANGGVGYMQQFASFLGGVAGYGPDAIEVWNEPNIEREWPHGQISGTTYAQMLQMAYQAIKSTNGGVMVISAAPAPTGAEAAYPGAVMNDDRFLRELVAAGGLNYMDCLGAHYNEGITPPGQFGGDPRDNYYTRYFFGMVNTYWGITGGQRPICFTELGFLTPEGYGSLPGFFSWAQNVTVAQQAAWLAEAAALASQSGKVRLMIIWNVDFTAYGSDPQGGYAIVRPGGGCPACAALAAAR